jgi:hypothetical protein
MAPYIRLGLFVISWLSVIVLPKNSFKKYLPVANLASSIILIQSLLSLPYKLWVVEEGGIKDKVFNDLSIILGPFFIGTIWIFHFTFGNLRLYLLVNMLTNFLFAFPMSYLFKKLKLYKFVNFRPIHIFITQVFYSICIYGYQLFLNKIKH